MVGRIEAAERELGVGWLALGGVDSSYGQGGLCGTWGGGWGWELGY